MGKFNEYLDIEPKIDNIKDGEYKKISFWGIKDRQDAEDTLNRIAEPGDSLMGRPGLPNKNIKRAWYAATRSGVGLFVIVPTANATDFITTGLKSIIFSFLASKKYDQEKILRLEDVVAHKLESSDTLSDKFKAMSQAEISVADLWQKYLNNINDPATREALKLYSQIYSNTSYGHALSLGNVLRIRAINPDATFVVSESTWNSWGFGIKKGAQKYPMWRVVNKYDPSQKDIDIAKAKLGHELENLGDLGVAVRDAIRIEAQKEANKGVKTVFLPYYGYDISDVYQYNPNEPNPLTTQANISSNVVYKLNALAQELEDKKRGELSGKDAEIRDAAEKQYTVSIDIMSKLCTQKGIQIDSLINSETSLQDKLIKLLETYYNYVITEKSSNPKSAKNPNKINVLKPENIQKYIQDAVQLTLLMNNIPYNMNNFTHSLEYTQNEAATLGPIIKVAAESIGRALNPKTQDSLNEGIFDGWFGQAFKRALDKLGINIVPDNQAENENSVEMQLESIKENFNKLLYRINNPIIY